MSAAASSIDGITAVSLAELIALRARAGKPRVATARTRTSLAGGHVSSLRGRGMDYAESRVYQPGDDARNIDWRRTARSGEWHTKLFQEERERSLLLLIDTHSSMRFGTRARYKSVAAARAAALAAWTAIRGGDRVGALAFGDVRDAIDPHGGMHGALAVLGTIASWDARSVRPAPSDERRDEILSGALERARRLVLPGSRALLLSDGWCTDEAAQCALSRLTQHADLRALIVVDALEHDLPPAGAYTFETTGGRTAVDLAVAAARTRFRDTLSGGQRLLASACDGAGVQWALLDTRQEPDAVLAGLWNRRGARR